MLKNRASGEMTRMSVLIESVAGISLKDSELGVGVARRARGGSKGGPTMGCEEVVAVGVGFVLGYVTIVSVIVDVNVTLAVGMQINSVRKLRLVTVVPLWRFIMYWLAGSGDIEHKVEMYVVVEVMVVVTLGSKSRPNGRCSPTDWKAQYPS